MKIPAWVDGQLIAVDKLEVHQRGLRHKAVSVFLICDNMVLLQRRALGKYHTPGLWANTCCTHPDWDEDPLICANRRLEEELGILNVSPVHKGQVEYRADVGGNLIEHEVVELFVAQCDIRPDFTPNPDEVMATKWVAIGSLAAEIQRNPQEFTPWMRIYTEKFSDLIFGKFD